MKDFDQWLKESYKDAREEREKEQQTPTGAPKTAQDEQTGDEQGLGTQMDFQYDYGDFWEV